MIDGNMNLKLIDFGFSLYDPTSDYSTEMKGTRNYMSPQILAKEKYNKYKNDIFQLGIILFILNFGYPPFNSASQSD